MHILKKSIWQMGRPKRLKIAIFRVFKPAGTKMFISLAIATIDEEVGIDNLKKIYF
jgi:hypothetical protein